jgi:hypothetical protein
LRIEGYFKTLKRANDTLSKLKAAGFNNSYVDNNDHLTNSDGAGTNLAGSENGYSLSNLTLESGGASYVDSSKAPLLAASPMASGMGGFSEIADLNCKVVVESDSDEEQSKIKEIISSMEGELESPNINIRKSIKNIKLDDISLD